jgi:two-component system, chemotaxis family, protein-glutamate methylesterase/glutaminase
VSTLTQRGAEVTLSALEIGAVDYFAKPTDNVGAHLEDCSRELCEKVRTAAAARVRPYVRRDAPVVSVRPDFDPGNTVVAIGSSTGGVEALIQVLSRFPSNCPATVITQHMPAHFTTSFADRLNRLCQPSVAEARDGAELAPGQIYLAPGGEAHLEVYGTSVLRCRLVKSEQVNGHRPSVDVLFNSVATTARHNAIGVILTGMGRDGASGLLAMRKNGASTVGQDEASSVVYGMPRVAYEIGAVERQFALHQIGQEVLNVCELRTKKVGRHAASI